MSYTIANIAEENAAVSDAIGNIMEENIKVSNAIVNTVLLERTQ